jgi:hypothetical protein
MTDKYSYPKGALSLSVCAYCIHKRRGAVCDAFPDGIPDPILHMENDHTKPYEGDHGIQFTPREGWDKPVPKPKPIITNEENSNGT